MNVYHLWMGKNKCMIVDFKQISSIDNPVLEGVAVVKMYLKTNSLSIKIQSYLSFENDKLQNSAFLKSEKGVINLGYFKKHAYAKNEELELRSKLIINLRTMELEDGVLEHEIDAM